MFAKVAGSLVVGKTNVALVVSYKEVTRWFVLIDRGKTTCRFQKPIVTRIIIDC